MARPIKEISQKQFESLCAIQCTEEEICAVLDVDDKTLTNWCKKTYNKSFSEVFREKRQGGKASLRRNQWKLSETNPTMAIFLGKQYLGQKDRPEETATAEVIQQMMQGIIQMGSIASAPVADRNIEDLES